MGKPREGSDEVDGEPKIRLCR